MKPFNTWRRPRAFDRFACNADGPFSFIDTTRYPAFAPFRSTYYTRIGVFTGHRLPCACLAADFFSCSPYTAPAERRAA